MEWRIGNKQQEWIVSAYWLHFATDTETIIPPSEGFIFGAAAYKAGSRLTGALLVPVTRQLWAKGLVMKQYMLPATANAQTAQIKACLRGAHQYNQLFPNHESTMLTRPQSPTCQPISWMQFSLRQGWVANGFGSIRQAKSWAWEPCCVLQVTVRVWTPSPQLAEHCRKEPNSYKEAPGFHLHFHAALPNIRAEHHFEIAPTILKIIFWDVS